MANNFLNPFNFNPVNVDSDSSTYTVPTGKYAHATITLSVTAEGHISDVGGTTVGSNTSSGSSNSAVIQVWLMDGDALTKATVDANASDTSDAGGNDSAIAVDDSEARVLLNATVISEVKARGSAGGGENGSGSITADVTGTASVTWCIQEFDVPT